MMRWVVLMLGLGIGIGLSSEAYFVSLVSGSSLLFLYAFTTGLRRDNGDDLMIRTGATAVLFTALGYFMIYLLRSRDLQWLLDTSSDRLLLQLWPSIVFTVFLACRVPEGAPEQPQNQLGADAVNEISSSRGSLIRR